MGGTFTAQLANRGGRWCLFVVLLGVPASQWPERDFGSAVVPTVQERSRVLNALGYVFTDGADWEWIEDSETFDDPSSPVLLIASATVREAT
ncbi:DUF6303 family protein [Streptomyces sp. NPDC002926]